MPFLSGIKNLRTRLTYLGEKEPLNFFSIVVILALDLFVLINIFQGLDLQTRQLESPSEVIPYQCLDLVNSLSETQSEERMVFNVLRGYNNYYNEVENKYSAALVNQKNKEKISPNCREIFDQAIALNAEEDIRWTNDNIQNLESEKSNLESEISQYENNYDTMLLERIANQQNQDSIIEGKADTVKKDKQAIENKVNTLGLRIDALKEKIMSTPEVEKLLSVIKENKEEILKQDKTLRFWHPIKRIGVELLFLLPMLIFFFYLYRRSLKKNKELLILIFSHLLVVVSIPIIFEVIRLVLDVIPFHVLADILAILEALNLIVIWNYILILLGIGIAIGLIYFVQKKLFSRERMYLKRIAQSKCYACGTKLTGDKEHCYKCGEKQMINCPNCQKTTYTKGTHCINCGIDIKEFSEGDH